MNIVVEVIAEYLRTNRRLVVPTFGAFMVKESGERLFSDLLNTDDGVLVALLREKGLSEMESAVLLDRFIFEIRHELEQYGYCRLAELGTLRIEPATKIVRLYPPIHSEVSQQETYEHKQMPYVPQSIAEPKPTEEEILQETPTQQPYPIATNATATITIATIITKSNRFLRGATIGCGFAAWAAGFSTLGTSFNEG